MSISIVNFRHTFEAAPVFCLCEKEVVRKLLEVCGFHEGDGILCPVLLLTIHRLGGSLANMYGLNLARFHYDSKLKSSGMFGCRRLVIFASEQAHYSIKCAAGFMGFGSESIDIVPCAEDGSMIAEELEKHITSIINSENAQPLCVWCTSGTTVLNAFDPIDKIYPICQRYKIWLHVDACLGGAVLLSSKHKYLMAGVENADSLVWNWHKLLGSPLQTSVFLCKHKGLLKKCHSEHASYLFPDEKHYDTSFDIGEASIQCSRKPDALKIWLMWKAHGKIGLQHLIDLAVDNAQAIASKNFASDLFYFLPNVTCWRKIENVKTPCSLRDSAIATTVCFWVIPPRLLNCSRDEEFWKEIDNKMSGLDALQERLARLERIVGRIDPNGGRPALFSMLCQIQSKVNAIYEERAKIKTLSDIVLQFEDMLKGEGLDAVVPDEELMIRLCEAAVPRLEKDAKLVQEMKLLEPVLDSEPIKSIPSLYPKMLRLLTLQEAQLQEVRKRSSKIDALIQRYNIFVECVEKQFLLWDARLRKLEALNKGDVEDSLDIAS
ncbi:unnamed protein product [Soboliphyme baturini]|uniref:Uncharacterized protein n=1 Tax=Soboliphyme baturini TaxID=241478 RepID=A0A3P8DDR6_9BILA|nr:unnamed protein product [Soboliphyme baturini]